MFNSTSYGYLGLDKCLQWDYYYSGYNSDFILEDLRIMKNLTNSKNSQKDESEEFQEDMLSQRLSMKKTQITQIYFNIELYIEEESEQKISKKEDSDQEYDTLPKRGDKVKVKYSDGWYTGRVKSISSKKKHFWVDFKGLDELLYCKLP